MMGARAKRFWNFNKRCATFCIRRYFPVFAAIAVVLGVFAIYQSYNIGPTDPFDSWLLIFIATAYLNAALVMVIFNKTWPLRAVGQLFTFLADGFFYGLLGGQRLGWFPPFTDGQLNITRAFFLVGAAALLIGLIWWKVQHFRGKGESHVTSA
jgi:hypothetical protein